MRPWKTCDDLLALFGISGKWASRFSDLVEVGALLKHYDLLGNLRRVERGFMRDLSLSPLVYWTNMKRAVKPMLDAGGDTLRALGVPVIEDPISAHELAVALVSVRAADKAAETDDDSYDLALQIEGSLPDE